MQKLPALLFLFLFFSSCGGFESDGLVKLTFRQLGESEKERFIADSLFGEQGLHERGLMKMKIQNRGYDSLFIPAYRLGKDLFCAPNGYKAYQIESDSLTFFKSSFPTHCQLDTAVRLFKNQSVELIFAGNCAGPPAVYEYEFAFMADSAGQKTYPKFMKFPCGNVLPKKKG